MSWKTFNTFLWFVAHLWHHVSNLWINLSPFPLISHGIHQVGAPHQVGFNRAPALHRVGPPTPGGHDIPGSMEIKVNEMLVDLYGLLLVSAVFKQIVDLLFIIFCYICCCAAFFLVGVWKVDLCWFHDVYELITDERIVDHDWIGRPQVE